MMWVDTEPEDLAEVLRSAGRILQSGRQPEIGGPPELADAFFAFRLLLGRSPSPQETEHLRRCAVEMTGRNVLAMILDSAEYRNQTRFLPAGHELLSDANGFRFCFRTGDREMGAPMALGVYEPDFTSIVRELARKRTAMVDCGAHTGYFTCTFLAGGGRRVTAFEPMDESFDLLRRNLQLNGFEGRCQAYPHACGSSRGEVPMSLVSGMLVGCCVDGRPTRRERIVRLDEVVQEPVDVIKLDVEGGEPAVLEGAASILREHRPILLTEVNDYWLQRVSGISAGDYVTLLRSMSYRVLSASAYARGREEALAIPEGDPLFVGDAVCVPAPSKLSAAMAERGH